MLFNAGLQILQNYPWRFIIAKDVVSDKIMRFILVGPHGGKTACRTLHFTNAESPMLNMRRR